MSGKRSQPAIDRSELRTKIARVRRKLDRDCREAIDPLSSSVFDHRHPFRSLLVAAALGIVQGLTSKRSPAANQEERLLTHLVYAIMARVRKEFRALCRRKAKSTTSGRERQDG